MSDGADDELAKIDIANLRIQLRAYFYRDDRDPNAARLSQILRASTRGRRPRLLAATLAVDNTPVVFAAMIAEHNPEPAFLAGTTLEETRYSLSVVAAWRGWLAVQTSGAGRWSDSVLGDNVAQVDADAVGQFVSKDGTAEKVKLRNMGIARNTMRSKTLEAYDLDPVLSPAGLNRQIPESVRFRRKSRLLNATPSTGRIQETRPRGTVAEFASWLVTTSNDLANSSPVGSKGSFLARFAQPIPLEKLDHQTPTALLLELGWLREGVRTGQLELARADDDGDLEALDGDEALQLADDLSGIALVGEVEIHDNRKHSPVLFEDTLPDLAFQLEWGVRAFTLRGDLIDALRVVNTETTESSSFSAALSKEHSLFVVFDDVRYAFAFGMLFRDREIATQATTLRAMLKPIAALATCKSEKGESWTTNCFPDKSVFCVIENNIAAGAPVLVCDDLGDEWADFISVDNRASPPVITLFHGKHDADTLGASAFQEVVGQAVKNRGRVMVRHDELHARKHSIWGKTWSASGSTKIKRVRRGGSVKKVIDAYATASSHPECRRRIALVVSFLSAKRMEEMLDRLEHSADPAHPAVLKPYEAQLVHLLVSYVSACREDGAEAIIYCAP